MPADAAWLPRLRGRFIVFEGPDGSGKSTQFRRLAAAAAAAGLPVCDVREPGGTAIGELVRGILLDPAHRDMTVECEMLLYMASRAQLVARRIRPALARGDLVLADRYVPSTLAYQGAAGGMPDPDIRAVARVATGGLSPDVVLLFDVDGPTAARRLSPLLDRVEAKGSDFHLRVRAGYLAQAAADPELFAVIDSARSEESVWQDVASTLSARSTNWAGRPVGPRP